MKIESIEIIDAANEILNTYRDEYRSVDGDYSRLIGLDDDMTEKLYTWLAGHEHIKSLRKAEQVIRVVGSKYGSSEIDMLEEYSTQQGATRK